MQLLSATRFAALWHSLGAEGDGAEVFDRLRRLYGEPHRAYHGASHIHACLEIFDDAAVRSLSTRPDEVLAALWFHDAIYDPRASDNEEVSACFAEAALAGAGVEAEVAARIGAHVRATKSHVATTPDAQVVIDIDLSILGETRDVFARFEAEIRQEYAWVEPSAYVAGRSAVLRRFLERPVIYGTPLFRERYEAAARANLGAALADLEMRAAALS